MFKKLNYEIMNEEELMNLLQKDWIKLFQTIAYIIVCVSLSILLFLWKQNYVYIYGTLSIGFFFMIYVYMTHVACVKFGWPGIAGLIVFFAYISNKIECYDEIFPYITMLGSLLLFVHYCVCPIIEILRIKKKTNYTFNLDFPSSIKLIGKAIYSLFMYCLNIFATFFLGLFSVLQIVFNFVLAIFAQ